MTSHGEPTPSVALAGLSTSALLDEAVAIAVSRDLDGLRYWDCLRALHRRPNDDVFEAARGLCAADGPHQRELGAHILAKLGAEEPRTDRFFPLASPILEDLLGDPDPGVVVAAISGLGHLSAQGVRWPAHWLRPHAASDEDDVRHAAALSLGAHLRDASSDALSVIWPLCSDADTEIRDWAVFGVARSEFDSEAIREMLRERLLEDDGEIRGEALVGLARRRDEAALPAVRHELTRPDGVMLGIEAAETLAAPELLPVLQEMLPNNPAAETEIRDAMAACRRTKATESAE